MKKYIILHLSLILLVFIACTDDQKQDDKNITFQRSDFKVRKSLSGKTIEFDSLILRPSQIQLFDSFLVTCNQGAEKQFHIFNLNTAHKEGECIPVGQGPKEPCRYAYRCAAPWGGRCGPENQCPERCQLFSYSFLLFSVSGKMAE